MGSRIAILPTGVLDNLVARLNANTDSEDGSEAQRHLRFLRLPHPRTSVLSLFLPSESSQKEKSSILEVQVVAPPNERSWFISEGEVIEDGQLLLFTPIDPAFLLIPILQLLKPVEGSPGNFRPIDDIFDDVRDKLDCSNNAVARSEKDMANSMSLNDLSAFCSLNCVRSAMRRLCEVKEITPEIIVYRYSPSQVLGYMKAKVVQLAKPETFDITRTLVRNLAKDGLMEDGNEALLESGRLRAACELLSQYLPKNLYTELLASYDFTVLEAYHKTLQSEQASISASDMSKIEDKESKSTADTTEIGKKRKPVTRGSYGVEKLKKANTKGMAKLSNFFQKAS